MDWIVEFVNTALEWVEFFFDWLDYYKEHKPD